MAKQRHSETLYQKFLQKMVKNGKFDPSKDPDIQRLKQKFEDIKHKYDK
jgi:hypothetical protein